MANLQKLRNGSLSQAPEEQEPAAVEDDEEEHPRRKPTISKYVMDKVWINAATLGLMFKSEANLPSSSSSMLSVLMYSCSAQRFHSSYHWHIDVPIDTNILLLHDDGLFNSDNFGPWRRDPAA